MVAAIRRELSVGNIVVMKPNSLDTPDSGEVRWLSPTRFAVLLALALALVFPKLLLGWETLIYRDFGVLAYPSVFHHHESFWRGELPLWNPLSNCGAPFLAQWGTMILYPLSLFYLLLPLPWSLNVFCVGHLFLAGFGIYMLARNWTKNRFAACVSGMAFVFNGVTFSCLLWPNYTVALGWMPWVVLSLERACRDGGRAIVAAALVAMLQMLSGVPELVLLTWILALALWATTLFQERASASATALRLIFVGLLTSGLMAVQLLPFLELLAHSHRTLGVNTAKWSLPIWSVANQFVPLFHSYLTPQGVFFQYGQEFLSSTYLGILPLGFACFAFIVLTEAKVRVLGAIGLISFWMAMGDAAGLYALAKTTLPLFSIMRYSVKFLLLAAFVFPLLAAYAIAAAEKQPSLNSARARYQLSAIGVVFIAIITVILLVAHRHPWALDRWEATWQSGLWRAVFLVVGFALLAWFVGASNSKLASLQRVALLLVIVVDALTHVPNQNPTLPSNTLASGLWTLSTKMPAPQLGESRIMISPHAEQHLLISRVGDLQHDFLGKRLALWSHLNLLEQIPKVNGSSTLQIREQMEVQSLLYASTNTDLPRLMDFLSVSTATALAEIVEWARRDTALPMVTAGQKPIFADRPAMLSALTNSTFNPVEHVYLPSEAEPILKGIARTDARIVSQRWTAQQIELDVEAPTRSLVVVAQSHYPAWHAYVDRAATRIWPANHAFQAIEIPAGRHHVLLRYEDSMFRWGVIISGVALVYCVSVWFRQSTKGGNVFPSRSPDSSHATEELLSA